jgi:hypothetical protein
MFKKLKAKLWLLSVSKKEDVQLFWCSSLNRLLGDQIVAILKIIDEELVKSFDFGLKLSHEHVLKEKTAVLATLNSMGNLCNIKRDFSLEAARAIFLNSIYQMLEAENKFYFEESKKKGGVNTMYNCHLEAVTASIFNEIYSPSGKIPYV